jgi:hypothetical protein
LAGDFDPSPRRKKATFHLKIDAAVPVENIGYIQKKFLAARINATGETGI